MQISSEKLNQIKETIQKYMNVLMFITTGTNKPSQDMLSALGVPRELHDTIQLIFKYGKLGVVTAQDLKELSIEEIRDKLKEIKLTPSQNKALEFVNIKTGNEITNLTTRMQITIVNHVVQYNTSTLEGIRNIIKEGMFEKTVSQVANELREFTEDWTRDWDRVAHSEMWNAKVNGEVMSILENESPLSQDGEDTLVFKRPAPDACKHCKKHYLEPDGVTPKVFKLKDILANGTNDNKRTSEWLPVVGIMHPNCICPLSIMPKSCNFDEHGQLQFDGELVKANGNLHFEQKTLTRNGQTYQQGFWVKGSEEHNPESQKQTPGVSVTKQEVPQAKLNDNIMGANQHTGSGKKIQPIVNNTTVNKTSPGTNNNAKQLKNKGEEKIHFTQLNSKLQRYYKNINNKDFDYNTFSKTLKNHGREQALDYLKSKGFSVKEKSTADDTWFNAMSEVTCYLTVSNIPKK